MITNENEHGPLYLSRAEAMEHVSLTTGSSYELFTGKSNAVLILKYLPDVKPVRIDLDESINLDTADWRGSEIFENAFFEYERNYLVRSEVKLAWKWFLYGGDCEVEHEGRTLYIPPAAEILDMVWAQRSVKRMSHRVHRELASLTERRREAQYDSWDFVDG